MYGTLVFSSILFISAQDAVKVAARYLASTLVCRVILMFEIMGMRTVIVNQAEMVVLEAPSERIQRAAAESTERRPNA
jgi:hypothetical protein